MLQLSYGGRSFLKHPKASEAVRQLTNPQKTNITKHKNIHIQTPTTPYSNAYIFLTVL
jgi:hypothetical protein